jgi:hypothetical protein
MWIVGAAVIVVLGFCVWALFFGGGDKGPFVALSKFGSGGKITGTRGTSDFQDDLRKPRNENELL